MRLLRSHIFLLQTNNINALSQWQFRWSHPPGNYHCKEERLWRLALRSVSRRTLWLCGKMTFRSLDNIRINAVWKEKCIIYDYSWQMGRWGVLFGQKPTILACFLNPEWIPNESRMNSEWIPNGCIAVIVSLEVKLSLPPNKYRYKRWTTNPSLQTRGIAKIRGYNYVLISAKNFWILCTEKVCGIYKWCGFQV